ncbi:17797_t:CDS:2, partial [Racocetra fulgida]
NLKQNPGCSNMKQCQSMVLQNKFTNTKRACAKHLLNCEYFAKRYTEDQIQEIVQKAKENGSKQSNKWL